MGKITHGKDYYIENGKYVFTEFYLKNRGFCCKNKCRHCPYSKKEITLHNPEDLKWLLERIQKLQNNPMRKTTHKDIWSGSYDVWNCEQDKIDSIEIPKRRMKEAEEAKMIESEIKHQGKYSFVVWKLTDIGKAFLENAI